MTTIDIEVIDNTPVVWLDSEDGMRHDVRSGADTPTPLTPEERVRVLVAQIEEGIADLHAAIVAAEGEQAQSQARATAATARQATLTAQATAIDAWRAAQLARAELVGGVAAPTALQLRDELVRVYQRLADVGQQAATMAVTEAQGAGAVAALSTDQSQAAGGLRVAYRHLIAMGRVVARVVTRVGADRRVS